MHPVAAGQAWTRNTQPPAGHERLELTAPRRSMSVNRSTTSGAAPSPESESAVDDAAQLEASEVPDPPLVAPSANTQISSRHSRPAEHVPAAQGQPGSPTGQSPPPAERHPRLSSPTPNIQPTLRIRCSDRTLVARAPLSPSTRQCEVMMALSTTVGAITIGSRAITCAPTPRRGQLSACRPVASARTRCAVAPVFPSGTTTIRTRPTSPEPRG